MRERTGSSESEHSFQQCGRDHHSAIADTLPNGETHDATHGESNTSPSANNGDPASTESASRPEIGIETTIKTEHDDHQLESTAPPTPHDDEYLTSRATSQPSAKRRESEAALFTPEPGDKRPYKKRRRAASPPWNFPSAETTTLRTADGRRVSARVNTSTPGLSEAEERGRGHSSSLSRPASHSRPPSPPWKKFEAAGPTTLQVDGKRKSGRVNKELTEVPKRVSPRSKKQADKLSYSTPQNGEKKSAQKTMAASSKRGETPSAKKQVNRLDRPSTDTASSKKIAELQAQIAALQPSRSFPAPLSSSSKENGKEHSKPGPKRKQSGEKSRPERPASPPVHRKMARMSNADQSPEKSRPSPKIKLRIGSRHVVPPPHPLAKLPSPLRPPHLSLYQIIERYELKEMQQPYTDNDRGPPDADYFEQRAARQAVEEGAMRKKLLQEAEPGGALSKEQLGIFQDERQAEPPQQYGHHDHLVSHVLYLRQLQLREKSQHRLLAKKLAHEALEKWKQRNGPTEEDLLIEEQKVLELVKKQVIADMKSKWEMVESHVREMKRKAWEVEQERIRAEKLQRKLEYSENLLAMQRGDLDSDADIDEDSTGDVEESDEDSEDVSEENMTESDSESGLDEAEESGEMDQEALKRYLEQRQADPPDEDQDEDDREDNVPEGDSMQIEPAEAGSQAGEQIQVEEEALGDGYSSRVLGATPEVSCANDVTMSDNARDMGADDVGPRQVNGDVVPESAALAAEEADAHDNLSSDESVEMYDSDEDMSSTDEEDADNDEDDHDDDEDESEEEKPSLLGFYQKKDLLRMKDDGLPTPVTSVENGGDNDNPRSDSEPRSVEQAAEGAPEEQSQDPNEQLVEDAAAPAQKDTTSPKEDNVLLQEPEPAKTDAEDEMEVEEEVGIKSLVPTPALLRGTLRSYQHAGLDWLASLYRNGTNGILADEMGLGKTIQTIALLAHLAEVHEVWETHLVIVPTSVILNWVTEFQKFLPGFRVLGYYGTAEERQMKRKGWTNDPHHEQKDRRGYNVVITSYNVAMQDINAIRTVQWHYLILDEAHNIRNFNSQRWQILIRLRTRARLLLTGTPLQNDLAEVWSLLTFLTAGDDDSSHGELEEFLSHWKDPVKEIFDQGVQKISDNAQRVVEQLHISLRPYLLRRKKSEVEKDLPKKTESVVVCKLSKRQRQLYQDYMGLAETKATLAKGSGVQAAGVLLALRKVCNHPDLFDPRPIQTSFAMESSPVEDYSATEQLVRQLLGVKEGFPARLLVANNEGRRRAAVQRSRSLDASGALQRQIKEIEAVTIDMHPDPATLTGSRALQRLRQREHKLSQFRSAIQVTESALRSAPIYGSDLRELVTVHNGRLRRLPRVDWRGKGWLPLSHQRIEVEHPGDWLFATGTQLHQDIATCDSYAERMQGAIVRFTFVPPAVTVPILNFAISPKLQENLRASPAYPLEKDWSHEARVRSSIAFPDSRLLIFDSGKLQRLVYLLRDLQSRGSRSLIFTQMTGTLNVLEQFLNLLNLPYLRLDGSTPVERRQIYSSEFNRPDSKYQCMILSSRAGGVGLNLTGASSVIFFDLDWNPQMDRQCMDRAHRIGQVRDVEVYKMVSEKTVEENILRRANQKSLLDQTVIQEGHFTTEYQKTSRREQSSEGENDVEAAIERFLGGDDKNQNKALESVEDQEDVQAAQQAAKEDRQDDVDFTEQSSKGPSKANTPGPGGADAQFELVEKERGGHVDLFMIKFMERQLQDWRYTPPSTRLDKHGRDRSHRPKKRR
ncbi:SNF2 family DNA-dependent ATPase [Lecanosticta acicola]|uniref:DNA helicase n=1 Tax=Lecanosticta acicola TaxID=111012 RepID=A0AAI8YPC4_9PEZI|nr:SNF2 family DNA-dependent ATPase [Lecanosticta acicola]